MLWNEYFDNLMILYPNLATFVGLHKYDHAYENNISNILTNSPLTVYSNHEEIGVVESHLLKNRNKLLDRNFKDRHGAHNPVDLISMRDYMFAHRPKFHSESEEILYGKIEQFFGRLGELDIEVLKNNLFAEFITDHLFYFTEETLKRTLNLNGFDVLECKQRSLTYSASLKANLRLVVYDIDPEKNTKQIKEKQKFNKMNSTILIIII